MHCNRKVIRIGAPENVLKMADSLTFDLWLRADDAPSIKPVNFIIYYESVEESGEKVRYRRRQFSAEQTVVLTKFDARINLVLALYLQKF